MRSGRIVVAVAVVALALTFTCRPAGAQCAGDMPAGNALTPVGRDLEGTTSPSLAGPFVSLGAAWRTWLSLERAWLVIGQAEGGLDASRASAAIRPRLARRTARATR